MGVRVPPFAFLHGKNATRNANCKMQNLEEKKNIKSFDLGIRTKDFALQIIQLYKILPESVEAKVIGKQVLRSGTSVGAQYREAKRARSKAEFLAKIEGALQELEETGYWLELLVESRTIARGSLIDALFQEHKELTAILISSANTVNQKK